LQSSVGTEPEGIAVAPDGGRVYVTGESTDSSANLHAHR